MNKSFQLYNIQREIEDKFNSLLKSGKMNITLTEKESVNRRNIQIDEEYDEILLEKRRDEYFKDNIYTCVKCKHIKPRQEFFHNRDNEEGISHKCKVCEMKYKNGDKG